MAKKGQPNPAASRPLAVRLWEKVERRADGCWLWTGAKDPKAGYGRIWTGDGTDLVHRVAWRLAGHELPDRKKTGLVLDHLCKNRACVNVDHLRVTTQHANSTENSDSPLAQNARKTHCRHGHPLTLENIAIVKRPGYKSPLGWKVGKSTARVCLICFPTYWRHAAIPRPRPPGSRVKAGDPDYQ